MANPVTYNSGSNPTGALKSGTVSMSVAPSLDISGYNWRNGFENNNIWVIYSDTFSQGLTTQGNSVPTIWGTPQFTEAGLLNLINVLPARAGLTAFTTLSSAISWLYGEGKYFLSNQNYPQMVVSGLVLFLDAGLTASFPNTGTNWYDLAGVTTSPMINGPVWNNYYTKSYIQFDGSDDYVNFQANNLSDVASIEMVCRITSNYTGKMFVGWNGYDVWCNGGNIGYNTNNGDVYGISQATVNSLGLVDRWVRYIFEMRSDVSYTNNKIIINGVAQTLSQQGGSENPGTRNFNSGAGQFPGYRSSPTSYVMDYQVNSFRVYNKSLSQSEIDINYYQGNIVTSNLKIAIDPANIISYPTSGTAWYDMSPTKLTGTLSNGPTYNSALGGYFSFDGTDDLATFGNPSSLFNPATSTMTMMGWIYVKNLQTNILIGIQESGAGSLSLGTDSNNKVRLIVRATAGSQGNVVSNTTLQSNRWYHIAMTKDTANSVSNCSLYINGVLDVTSSSGVNFPTSTSDIRVGVYLDALTYSNINVGNIQVYDTALTQAQISQNYGAFSNRYEYFGAFAQGGTESTVTQNGVTYRVHTFLSSSNLTITESGSVEVLVVAGGGSGGGSTAGGGGAGGLIYDNSYYVNAGQTITVTVGAAANGVGPTTVGNDGNNSVFGDITATGGGGGGMTNGSGGAIGRNGGSGGGGAHYSSMNFGTPGTGIAGQGYDGGNGSTGNQDTFPSGGGGGAGGKGGDATNTKSGNGGIGQPYGLTGTTVYYAGGGGGGSQTNGGDGGAGGGGAGTSNGNAGANAQTNTGGGGGGGWLYCCGSGGAGGSGLIIVRYPIL